MCLVYGTSCWTDIIHRNVFTLYEKKCRYQTCYKFECGRFSKHALNTKLSVSESFKHYKVSLINTRPILTLWVLIPSCKKRSLVSWYMQMKR